MLTLTERPDSLNSENLVRIHGLKKCYWMRRSIFGKGVPIQALDDIELEIRAGSTLALVGESGSGKSTLARCLARLEKPDSGEIWFDGSETSAFRGESLFRFRRDVQVIFQDPSSALNPRFSSRQIIEEPMTIQRICPRNERRWRSIDLMRQVGLPPSVYDRSPMDLSAGQRQRLAIARALALTPRLLILDEAFSGLDLSIKAQLVNLLLDLQKAASLTYLYIAHDLDLVAHFADEIAIMHRGRIIESGATPHLFREAGHPYTRALLESFSCAM